MRPLLMPPAFWQQPPGLWARFLAPAGGLYGRLVMQRMEREGQRVGIPVVCIGNFTLGGAGKTPTAIAVSQILRLAGEKPFFLTRGYGGRERGPLRILPEHGADQVGDEPLLLAAVGPVILAADRVAGARMAREAGASVLLMDDGFQNPALVKDGALVVVDGASGVGNGQVFPAGPLRAPLDRQMPHATAVIVIGSGDAGDRIAAFARGSARPVFRARLVPVGGDTLAGRRILAFAGIGRPEKFRQTLVDLGAEVVAFEAFADHHRFSESEAAALAMRAQRDGLLPVTTQKDHVRLAGGPARSALASMTTALPVRVAFDDEAGLRRLLLGFCRR